MDIGKNMNQSDDHSQLLILELDVETLETSNTTINFSIFELYLE